MKETPISGEAINAAEQAKMMGVSGVEAGSFENDQGNKEDPFAVGRARQEAISKSLTETKKKVTGWFSRAAGSISKFFKKDVIPAILSTDVLLTKGADALVDKAEAFDKKTAEQAYAAGVGMGKGIAEGYHNVKDKITEAGSIIKQDWVEGVNDVKEGVVSVGRGMNKGADAFVNWGERTGDKLNTMGDKTVEFISDKVLRGGDATVEAFKSAAKWTDEKMMATADYLAAKEMLLADKIIYAGEKTSENLGKVKDGIANQFNNLKNFSERSIMAFKMRMAERKQRNIDKRNAKLQAAMIAKHNAELEQLRANVINNAQGEEWAKNQVEAYRQAKEASQKALDEKIGHMASLENLFNSQAA